MKQNTKSDKIISYQFDFNGFFAGILSGATKLAVGHPFDTIKIRLQTNISHFGTSAIGALRKTIRQEGFRGLYKGGSPPLFGWVLMDSVGLGSLENYKSYLRYYNRSQNSSDDSLSYKQHALAGTLAGLTVSFVATPIELLKSQMQRQFNSETTIYKNPIQCSRHIINQNGILGLWRGLDGNFMFRGLFCILWASYEYYTQHLLVIFDRQNWNKDLIPFFAGGLSANTFWCIAFPTDVIKNRIMSLPVADSRYQSINQIVRSIYLTDGVRGFYRGFLPCILRSFPTNGAALLVFKSTMAVLEKI